MNYLKLNINIKNIIRNYILPCKNIIIKYKKTCLKQLQNKTDLLKYCIDKKKYLNLMKTKDGLYYSAYNQLDYHLSIFKIKKDKIWIITIDL